ncbi:MAG: tRNA preQ1(34) S-adenosylmethionine ribosyltransferase-isomerase QueA [Magnetovibrio sp.]|nr:tRNA preQ1(34) S-adenosylmethionine ribosyltransferase-isomerase QueA [Magnetovibrio sp.]|tara:strand:- start:1238 stop:2272 length:1035 start_codon:yes stop_codon:yes gene_type:complete
MKVDDFDFDLPHEYIAQRPTYPRDHARLLIGNDLSDKIIADLPACLNKNDILVFNDTQVIPARLLGKHNESKVEVTLHLQLSKNTWRVFAKPAKKLCIDHTIKFADEFCASVINKGNGGEATLRFNKSGSDLMKALETFGKIPLPPYIKREGLSDEQDKKDYQTLFAKKKGAVAAPTAGLHFTQNTMTALENKGIKYITLTLHVGAGTFLPVKVDNTDDHVMHPEWGEITPRTAQIINTTKASGGRIVAVGTTSMRLLETATDAGGILHPYSNETNIFITPGYHFRMVDVLLTNFHLPRSTLFMLVCAFAGSSRIKKIYKTAMERDYRFYSYGDATLLQKSGLT